MFKIESLRGHKVQKLIFVIIFVAIVGAISWYVQSRNSGDDSLPTTSEKYEVFEGTVTGRDNGCSYDASCSITVDDRVIITGGGLTNNQEANIYGVVDADLSNGDHVRVKALNTENGLTLQGCRECYVTRGKARGQ